MEFRILGPLEVEHDGRVLALGSGRQLALVAVLLLHRNEVVSVDRLVDELWDGDARRRRRRRSSATTCRCSARSSATASRRVRPATCCGSSAGELDSDRPRAGGRRRPSEASTDALALWRGPPLAQFAYERFAQAEIARLEELRLAAIESRIDAELARGRHAPLMPELEALVQVPASRAPAGTADARALPVGSTGGRARGLSARARSLDDELGIEPGAALRDLERQILNQDASLAAPRTPVGRGRDGCSDAGRCSLRRGRRTRRSGRRRSSVATRESQGGLSTVPPNYVGVDRPVDSARSWRPCRSASGRGRSPLGLGSVWVGNVDDRSLTRIDPLRGAAAATVSLTGAPRRA